MRVHYLEKSKLTITTCMLAGLPFIPSITFASSPEGETISRKTDKLIIQQQTIPIRGTVIDATTGDPIIGANVLVKGTTNGTSTDYDGKFALDAPEGSLLVVSYIGYVNLEVNATRTPMSIRIKEDTQNLDEVVVVGYGTQRKESLTGALQTLKSEKLTDITTPNVENMLNGKAPGVYVYPGGSQPGAEGVVVIRGTATINGSTDPLWVVDGVIMGNKVGALNPADIETVTVLKDAASTAIYGSQGANGVIVVTTKSAQSGKMKLNVGVKLGISNLTKGNLEMMDGAELYDYYCSFSNADEISFTRWNSDLRNSNFDWWDLASTTGFTQDYSVSLSGGTDQLKSFFSLGVYDESGAVKGYDYTRYNFRMKVEYKPFKWLTIRPQISGSKRDIDDREYDVYAMYSNLPWDSPYDENGDLVPNQYSGWVNSTGENYLYDLQWNYNLSDTYEFFGNIDFDIKFTDWLTFSSVNNYKYKDYEYTAYSDPRSIDGESVEGRIEEQSNKTIRRYTNQILRFTKSWGKHSINALAAYEFNDYSYETLTAIGTGFVPGLSVLDATATPEATEGSLTEWAMQSYLFNAHYTYDNRYYGQVSFRRDGASNFGDDKKYGNFFSVSAGWNINRERWFKANWVDILKLRISYGSTGNRPSDYYPQYDLYSATVNYDGNTGLLISQVGNSELTWEKTYTLGVGIDANFFENRLRMNLDYYNKKTKDILYEVPKPGLTGVTSLWQNVGEMKNNGIEIMLGGDIIRTKDWTWSLDFNLGYNHNEIVKLYNDTADDGIIISGGTSIDTILLKGESIGTYYGREWAGVNSETGAAQWYTTDDDGNRVITEDYSSADEVIIGKYTPDVTGGIQTTVSWRNLDLSANFGYSIGGQIYNYFRQVYDSDGAYTDRNQMKLQDGWSRWEEPGDIATHPIASYNNSTNSNKPSSRYIEDSDFFKLRTLTIGYNLQLPQYYIQNLRVFFTAENVFTITEFSGVDPELPTTQGEESVSRTTSMKDSTYPTARKFMFGVNFSF